MKTKLRITVFLLLLVTLGYAQQNTSITKLPDKGTLQQNNTTDKVTAPAVKPDSPNTKTFDVAEGKKGLNAVNVRKAVNQEKPTPTSDHAINTKGTGATRDK